MFWRMILLHPTVMRRRGQKNIRQRGGFGVSVDVTAAIWRRHLPLVAPHSASNHAVSEMPSDGVSCRELRVAVCFRYAPAPNIPHDPSPSRIFKLRAILTHRHFQGRTRQNHSCCLSEGSQCCPAQATYRMLLTESNWLTKRQTTPSKYHHCGGRQMNGKSTKAGQVNSNRRRELHSDK